MLPSVLAPGLAILLLAGGKAPAKHPTPAGYRLRKTIPLPGDELFDRVTLDSEARRLYLTRDTRVVVLDLASEKVLGEVDSAGARGVALVKDLKRGFASNGADDSVTAFDTEKLKEIERIAVPPRPDAILYDPPSRRVLVFDAHGGVTAIDPSDDKVLGSAALGGRPRGAVSDQKGTVWVNVEDKSEIVALDPVALAPKGRWPLAPCESPRGLAIDQTRGRLFVGCRNQLMAVVAAGSGEVLATLPVGKGVDDTAVDEQRGLAFAANVEGTLTVVKQDPAGGFKVVENATTQPGAKTMAIDPKTHFIYLVTCRFGQVPLPSPADPHPHAPVIPGTFAVLVFRS